MSTLIKFIYSNKVVYVLSPLLTIIVAHIVYKIVKSFAKYASTKKDRIIICLKSILAVAFIFSVLLCNYSPTVIIRELLVFVSTAFYACLKAFEQSDKEKDERFLEYYRSNNVD